MSNRKYKYGKIKSPENDVIEGCPSFEDISVDEDEESKFMEEEMDEIRAMAEREESPGKQMRSDSLGRRNSISLPNLDEIKVFPQIQVEDYDKSKETINSEATEDDPEFQNICGYNRSVRRKSVLSPVTPVKMQKGPGEDIEAANHSPANSITSVNSLASLLREKIQGLPQTLRRKKTPEYKTKIFVALLFIAIVILIVSAYFLYQQKILAKAYFEKIKLNKVKRVMKIYNNEGIPIVNALLGTTINYDKVLPCLPADQRNDGSICLEWMDRARLYLNFIQLETDVKCYTLQWTALSENIAPTDCFDMTNNHWYGGGQTAESAWPLEKSEHDFQPFITGRTEKHGWGNVLKRYFISSKGVAIIVDNKTPLYVSISGSGKQFCIRAQYDDFAFVNRFTPMPQLNYSMCTSYNMSDLHEKLSEHTLWDGLKKEDTNIIDSLLTEPVWEITSDNKNYLTEETIYNFTDDITNSVLKQGHVLINEFWQDQVGDFELDLNRFPTLEKTMEMLKRRGFRVVFTIQPFISTESFNFAEAVRKRLLVSERFSDRSIPALTRYKTLQSAGVLDITNEKTVRWLIDKLKKVMEKYKFDAFYLDMGIAYNMPHYYQCEKPLLNPDQYKTLFTNSLQGSIPLFGVNSAIQRPKAPSFIVLPEFESSWEGLGKVIPTILTYGIIGYPFLIPGAVGGDYESPDTSTNGNANKMLPDPELYTRWLQLSAFLPVVRYHNLPSAYGDKNISDMAISLAITRQTKVTPRLKRFARVSLNLGLPIIRPLWMLDSEDPSCHTVMDEFSIGDELIVAPILHSGRRQREYSLI
ncbi:unnamed protein product [Acanthoscelides obtectus]|uniref:Family 31 glucosidase KIAA1161 n=1 Tax=Acanthoscelides obtectus TaxID=200917 RepID=A0A9P0PT22_ACAOB|nr:unnamed protein product [Acanthoscelides obtectus]CAK1653306.1 Myogenesis-regulating glycosidase [Acanthoscelides obtectus]